MIPFSEQIRVVKPCMAISRKKTAEGKIMSLILDMSDLECVLEKFGRKWQVQDKNSEATSVLEIIIGNL